MRIALMVRPDAGVAEATKLTGEFTVAPLAGEETVMPPEVVVEPLTVMFMELLKTCPAAFQAWTMAEWLPAGRATEVFNEAVLLLKLVLLKVYML